MSGQYVLVTYMLIIDYQPDSSYRIFAPDLGLRLAVFFRLVGPLGGIGEAMSVINPFAAAAPRPCPKPDLARMSSIDGGDGFPRLFFPTCGVISGYWRRLGDVCNN